MTKVSVLLDTKTRDLMKHVARKEQTYDSFIVELLNLKIQSDSMRLHSDVGVDEEKGNLAPGVQTKDQIASSMKVVEGEP